MSTNRECSDKAAQMHMLIWTYVVRELKKGHFRALPLNLFNHKSEEIGCLKAETRQQEASIRQRTLQLFRCTGTQFRRCRWELDSLQRHRSLFSNGFPRTSVSQTPRLVWWEWQRNPGTPWRETPKIQGLPQNYQFSKTACSNISKTVQTRLRDMQDSWLSKKADEIQSFSDRKHMKKFFDALKTVYGPQSSGTTPLLSADGTCLLTDKEESWKDGLNTLMVSLIDHHLSMMKLSTDYYRWNVIRCLMSSQPSLRLWKL